MLQNVKEFSVPVSKGMVDIIKFGKGDQPLVMLPGLSLFGIKGSGYALTWYYRIFSKKYTVYLIDRVRPINSDCTIETMAHDIVEVLNVLKLSKVELIGVSQGGMIAQSIAIHFPNLVSKLVLALTTSSVNMTLKNTINRWHELASEEGVTAVITDYIENAYSIKNIKKYKRLIPFIVKLRGKRIDVDRFLTLAKACLTCDYTDKLEQIKCPVYVMGAEQDNIVSIEGTHEIIQSLKCDFYIYPDLGHEAYNEAKDFNRRIYHFLSGMNSNE